MSKSPSPRLLRESLGISVAATARWAGVTIGSITLYEEDPHAANHAERIALVYSALEALQVATTKARTP